MKILHTADWHLDSPLGGRAEGQTQLLKSALLALPEQIAALAKAEKCDLMLLAGDIFDGPATAQGITALKRSLEEVAIPVCITPGNHDFCDDQSPWLRESWPENVHIFTRPSLESIVIPALDCRIYGAGFQSMDCPGLLEGFQAQGEEKYHIGLLHGDAAQPGSPYCPITQEQVKASKLQYLALGHVHKGDSFLAGDTLCAWPGCPMGRGYDEVGPKGVLIVTVEDRASARFVSLDTPRFYDWEAPVETTPRDALEAMLPPVGNDNFYRITFTGNSPRVEIPALLNAFARFPHLELRDRTLPELDIWGSAGEDTLEGVYFRLLKDALEGRTEEEQRRLTLAAKISRQILLGQEVTLP